MLEVANYFVNHDDTTISYLVEYFKIHHNDKVENMTDRAISQFIRRQVRQLVRSDLLEVAGANERQEYIYKVIDFEKLQTEILDEIRQLEKQERINAMFQSDN